MAWAGVWVVLGGGVLEAHGDLREQIAAVSARLQVDPRNANLYLKRAELYRGLGEWDLALADYDRSAAANPRLTVVDLARGKTLVEAGRAEQARPSLDRFLARQPDHWEGLIARARMWVKLGRLPFAIEDYNRGIARAAAARAEYFLERARAQAGDGRVEEALRGLDEGVRRLGPLVTLEVYGIELELKQKRYDAALARLDRITGQADRKDSWLARRGEILEQAGRREEARRSYRAALAAIDSLPAARRNVPATTELERRLKGELR